MKLAVIIIKTIFMLLFLSVFITGCSSIPAEKWNTPQVIRKNSFLLEPGDILIKKKGAGFLEYFGHCGIVVNNFYIAEFPKVGYGMIFTPIENWLSGKRKVVVLRMKTSSPELKRELAEEIMVDSDKPYKLFINKKKDNGFYCSQFIWNIYYSSSSYTGSAVDLDSNGGFFVFPYDFWASDYLKEVQFDSFSN